ncbi:hypothetical protein [Draconibacterium orientale]|uniref:hypothetical protein n=1 Tax=Draconibacterium orientale TaxID=1168034 RepID=UPI002A0A1206|nr:hypothetical protein [Draconibacterium orientale]
MNKIVQFIVLAAFVCAAFSTTAGIVVLNGLTHEKQVLPGETYRGTIQIQNAGSSAESVRVYLRDYWYSFSGESRYDDGGTLARSNSGWISYNPEVLTLDSAEVATIEFEVKVPANDTLQGTYWSVIMVEGINEPDPAKAQQGVTVNTAIRYAIQVISNVGTEAASDLQFLGMELKKQEDENVLNIAIENTGECILRPEVSLELFDESGNSTAVIKSDSRRVLPGTSVLSSLVLKNVGVGKYNGVLIADCGEERLYGTNFSLEIE